MLMEPNLRQSRGGSVPQAGDELVLYDGAIIPDGMIGEFGLLVFDPLLSELFEGYPLLGKLAGVDLFHPRLQAVLGLLPGAASFMDALIFILFMT